jgi:formylglycine-generating enzyme required for sulfatase activity
MHRTLCLTLFLSCLLSSTVAAADKFALLVGITRYEHRLMNSPPLRYPEADADAVAQALEQGGYRVQVLKGKDATLVAIRNALDNFTKQSSADGVALIGLFGHGVQYGETAYFCPWNTDVRTVPDENGKPRLDKNGSPMLEPDPSTLISMRELLDAMTKSKAGSRILLADCCRNDPSVARGRNAFGSSLTTKDLPEGTAALFACSRDEQAFEHDEWKHGAFTQAFLNQLKNPTTRSLRAGTLAEQMHDDVLEMVQDKVQKTQTVTYIAAGVVDLQLKPRGTSRPQQLSNSIGQDLVLIPAGSFLMGSPEGEPGRESDEGPQHRVEITKAFYMGRTEVTQGQWRGVMGTEPWKGESRVQEGEQNAASYINWDDATEFCRRLSQREGKTYRLPTEAEWEYACRAGTTTRFHFGDDESQLGEYAWFDGNAYYKDEKYAHRVGQKKPNPFGLYDLHGNVYEWCGDWYDSDYYASSPLRDPRGPNSGSSRVLRGGSWRHEPYYVRCAYRSSGTPDDRNYGPGFRVVLE